MSSLSLNYMNVFVSASEQMLKQVGGGMSVIYFLTEKGTAHLYRWRDIFPRWKVLGSHHQSSSVFKTPRAGASVSQGVRAERGRSEGPARVLCRAEEWRVWTVGPAGGAELK